MKNSLLLSHKFIAIGWVTFICFGLLSISHSYLGLEPEFMKFQYGNCDDTSASGFCEEINLLRTIGLAGIIIGLLCICFSKTKNEDEYISFLRLRSWQWSVLISYLMLVILNFLVYSTNFLVVMMYNMFTILVVFIIKFNYSLYLLNKEGGQNDK